MALGPQGFDYLYGPERGRYIRDHNPFGRTVNVGGQPVSVASNFGDFLNSQNWINSYLARNAVNPAGGMGGINPGTVTNPLAAPGGSPLTANPFQTVNNVKSPSIQDAIDKALAAVNASSLVPGQQTQAVTRTVKSPGLQTAIDQGISRVQADASNNAQSVADFTKQFLAEQRAAQERAATEAAAISKVYDTGSEGVQATLNNMSESQALNELAAANRAMQRARGANNSARISGGDSSYNDALLARALGDIGTQGAIRRGDRDLTNYRNVLGLQAALPGVSNSIIDNALKRMLIPTQVGQAVTSGDLSNLGAVGNLDLNNSFFNFDTQDQALARRLDLLRGVTGLDQANNFYGLRQPYEPDLSGRLPIRLPRAPSDPGNPPGYYPNPEQPGGAPRPLGDGNNIPPVIPPPSYDPNWMYDRIAGINPMSDPNYSPQLMDWINRNYRFNNGRSNGGGNFDTLSPADRLNRLLNSGSPPAYNQGIDDFFGDEGQV